MRAAGRRAPDMRHGAQFRAQRVGLHQSPVVVQVFGLRQELLAEPVEGLLHRVERIHHTGEDRVFDQRVEGLGQRTNHQRVDARAGIQHHAAGHQVRHGHAVLGQGAGLVRAQHGGGAQCLDRVDAPRQHALTRQPPGAERREHCQHHRVFLGQHGHRQRDAGQQRLQPVAAQQAMHQHQRQAQCKCQQREVAHQPRGLPLQRRAFHRQAAEGSPDAADFAARTGGRDMRRALPLQHQRAGIDPRQVVAAGTHRRRRTLCGGLAHRHRLAGEQRLVEQQVVGGNQQRIGRHPVAFAQQQQVAAHHVTPRDTQVLAIAHHQRARAGEVAQGLDRAFGLAFLVQRQAKRDQHETEQREAFLQVAEREVQGTRAEQQQEHRFAHSLGDDRQQRAALAARQRVGAVFGQPARRVGAAQAGADARTVGGRLIAARHAHPAVDRPGAHRPGSCKRLVVRTWARLCASSPDRRLRQIKARTGRDTRVLRPHPDRPAHAAPGASGRPGATSALGAPVHQSTRTSVACGRPGRALGNSMRSTPSRYRARAWSADTSAGNGTVRWKLP